MFFSSSDVQYMSMHSLRQWEVCKWKGILGNIIGGHMSIWAYAFDAHQALMLQSITMPIKNFFQSLLAPTYSLYQFLYTTCKSLNCNSPLSHYATGTSLNCTSYTHDSVTGTSLNCNTSWPSSSTTLNCRTLQTTYNDMPSSHLRHLRHLGHLRH